MHQTSDDLPTQAAPFSPSSHLLEEAANWVIRLRYEAADLQTRQAFSAWLNHSTDNARAWAHAESVLGTFDQLPPEIGKRALQTSLKSRQRRAVLRAVTAGSLIVPSLWLGTRATPWRHFTADAHTSTGERRTLLLADGSRVVLNTASAVDIAFTASERRLILHSGEVLITTAQEDRTPYRPFVIQTSQGTVKALGTRFIVHELDHLTSVTVLAHAVQIQPLKTSAIRLDAAQQIVFDATRFGQVKPAAPGSGLWEQGMFVANDMRLADLLAELERYRRGVLQCDPAVSNLRVTAAISLNDTDAALTMLTQSLPIRIQRFSRYWVVVKPV